MRLARWYVVEESAGGWAGSEPIEADRWVITGRLTRLGARHAAKVERRFARHGSIIEVMHRDDWEGRPL